MSSLSHKHLGIRFSVVFYVYSRPLAYGHCGNRHVIENRKILNIHSLLGSFSYCIFNTYTPTQYVSWGFNTLLTTQPLNTRSSYNIWKNNTMLSHKYSKKNKFWTIQINLLLENFNAINQTYFSIVPDKSPLKWYTFSPTMEQFENSISEISSIFYIEALNNYVHVICLLFEKWVPPKYFLK